MRQIGPLRAAFLNLVGFGLGYVYVGRIRFAIAFVGAIVAWLAFAGWSRLVFYPVALYVLVTVVASATLFVIVHSGLIAARNRAVDAKFYNRWWIYVLWIVGSMILSHGLVSMRPVVFGFEPFRIPAQSMAPVVQEGDFVMADTTYFDHEEPKFGDIVVFRVPGSEDVKYLKRIIGVPGDRIAIVDDVLFLNGQAVDEPYVQLTGEGPARSRNFGPEITPENSYFVLGDNRHRSKDSRYIGPIEENLLHGRVIHRWFAYRDGVRWDRFPEMLNDDDR